MITSDAPGASEFDESVERPCSPVSKDVGYNGNVAKVEAVASVAAL